MCNIASKFATIKLFPITFSLYAVLIAKNICFGIGVVLHVF